MIIDLIDIINNKKSIITIDKDINYSSEDLTNTSIRKLDNVQFNGKIKKLVDDTFNLIGNLSGIMILPDDITLEDYKYEFNAEIDEILEENALNLQKSIDISSILWENILVEIPLRKVNPKNENIKLDGDGWRLIKEEDIETTNNPLSDLREIYGRSDENGSSI